VAQNESVLILTGKNISRMTYFKQFYCSIDYCQNTKFNARFLRDRLLRKNPSFEQDSCVIDYCVKTEFSAILLRARLLQESPRFPQDSVSQDYYKNQGDSRKIQSSGTNQERIMKPERIGNGTPPVENETPPMENESYPPTVEIKSYPPPMENESENILLTPPMENAKNES
jgi:hypothetical protein